MEYIKQLFLNLSGFNIQIPWIYFIQNKDLINKDNTYMDPQFDQDHQVNQKYRNMMKKHQI